MNKSIQQKIVAVATAITLSGMLAAPAYGVTADELQVQIQALLAQIATLQAQLSGLPGGSVGACAFSANLYLGVSGDAVKCLQQYLNGAGFQVAASGVGSPGSETMFYGSLTQAAVAKWQAANGVSPAAGYFGPKSRAKYTALAGVTPPVVGVPASGGVVVTTPGVEATLAVEWAPSPADNTIIKAGQVDVPVLGVRVKSTYGDAIAERMQFDFGTTTTIYTRQLSNMSLWADGVELARKPLNSTTVVKSGSRYLFTIDGFQKLVKAGGFVDFMVKASAQSSISSTYVTSAFDPSVYVVANGVRAIDGVGINQYAPSAALAAHTIDVQISEGEQATLTLSANANTPKNYRVVSDANGVVTEADLAIFDLAATQGRAKITDLSASIAESPDGSSTPGAGYLYQQVGGVWKLLASASFTSGGYVFTNLVDVFVDKDVTSPFKLAAGFTAASSSASGWVSTITTTDITALNDLGDAITLAGSTNTGNTVRVSSVGPILTLVSKGISYTPTSQTASGTLSGTFVVTVKAGGLGLYVPTSTATTSPFSLWLIDDDNASITSLIATSMAITYNQPSNTTLGTNGYLVAVNQSADFTVSVSAQSGQIDEEAGFDLGEFYKFRVVGFKWDTSDTASPAYNDTYMDATVWQTNLAYVN